MINRKLLSTIALVAIISMIGFNQTAYGDVTTSGAMISATAVSGGNANLAWSASVTNATFTNYQVLRSTSSGFDPISTGTVVCIETNIATLSCTDSTGVDTTTYFYRLISTDSNETKIADTPNEVTATVDSSLPVVTGSTTNITDGGNTELTATDQYTESCTATDNNPTNPTCSVQSGSIDTLTLGSQSVIYEATDAVGNVGTDTVSTTVVDTTNPTFNLVTSGISNGGAFVTNIVKDIGTYTQDTFENQADISGIASSAVSGDTIDESTIAVYTRTYTVTDNNGNSSIVTETINVIAGGTPVITLQGANPQNIVLGAGYSELGATADDTEDGNGLTVTNIDSSAFVDAIGSYLIDYNFQDSSGNDATTVQRTTNVIAGNAPVITGFGSDTTISFSGIFTPATASCTDVEDGPITVIVTNPVSSTTPGSYIVSFSCTDSSTNTTIETITVTVGAKPSGGSNANKHKTAPTSGNDWNTHNPLVKGGISVDGHSTNITDNWWTPFQQIQIADNSIHTFGVKTYAQNGGLMVQEIAFGIPQVGAYNEAEAMIEVWYNYDKTIKDVVIVQSTEVIDESALFVTTAQVSCDGGTSKCYQTNFVVMFREPLKDTVFAVKAFDMSRRSMMPHYFNDGILVNVNMLNDLPTAKIQGTEKHEGLITVTQTEKYSNMWNSDNGRTFELVGNDYRFIQTEYDLTPTLRVSDALKNWTVSNAVKVFDSSKIQGSDKGFIAMPVDEDGINHREQTKLGMSIFNTVS